MIDWLKITKVTAAGAVLTFTTLTALAFAAARSEQKAAEAATRVRWTDAARWER